MSKCKVIALCNQKGGVGKTTSAVNIGIGLVRLDERVLLVDADPQGHLTTSLGWPDGDKLSVTLATHMDYAIRDEPIDPHEGILHHSEGVDLLPANLELSTLELSLVNAISRESTMKNCLRELKKDYDYVLIDCMSSLGMITINALAAADSVIIPTQAQYLSAKGMTQLIQAVGKVQRQINPNLKIDGILPTLVDFRTNIAKETVVALQQNYGKVLRIYKTVIPVGVSAAETSALGKSIYEHDSKGKVAEAYDQLSKEVKRDGQRNRSEPSHGR